ncbi:nuclear transport factor 2 family protein [Mycolicibacterium sp. S2-37]|uniref:nuclear transport factor 2 family protein n=1 Tax=Mycolicibacterium sp. S2-37 TaxID=2810297 RepID=UPI001A9436C5|nr:nuclear transport factor 2 family protein [Mycolicibacterium sp. S2-37]MBO0676543.1 nuclear transport factor 2 family protein [Mycolicibacterium sp. S2-37]
MIRAPGSGDLSMNALAELIDRAVIADIVARLADAQDDRNWTALQELFADEVHLDLSRHHHGTPPATMAVVDLVHLARATLTGFDCTHHASSNLVVTLVDGAAHCRAHMTAYHHVPAPAGVVDFCTMRGYWELELRKQLQRWRIHHWSVVRTAPWEGCPNVYELAAARAADHRATRSQDATS